MSYIANFTTNVLSDGNNILLADPPSLNTDLTLRGLLRRLLYHNSLEFRTARTITSKFPHVPASMEQFE
jgi:hypothetical protein